MYFLLCSHQPTNLVQPGMSTVPLKKLIQHAYQVTLHRLILFDAIVTIACELMES